MRESVFVRESECVCVCEREREKERERERVREREREIMNTNFPNLKSSKPECRPR